MTDENNKAENTKSADAEKKSGDPKMEKKNKVIEKLQAMGVMSGGKAKQDKQETAEKKRFSKKVISVAVVVVLAGSFVWYLNHEAANDKTSSNVNVALPSQNNTHPWQSYSDGNQYGSSAYNAPNTGLNNNAYQNAEQKKWAEQRQNEYEQQQSQYNQWLQQQQEAYEQQRLQQQQWIQQQQQVQEQQRVEQERWAQQQMQQAQYQNPQWGQQQWNQPRWEQQAPQPQYQQPYTSPQYRNNGVYVPNYYQPPMYPQYGQYYGR